MPELCFRPHTWDENIWRSVVDHDEYGLGGFRFAPGDVVLDVGAHVGSFTYLCLDRGASMVVAVEPDTDNANHWRHNIHSACRAEGRSVLVTAAMAAGGKAGVAHYAPVGTNTGGGSTLGADGHPVAALPLDALLVIAGWFSRAGRVRLLKLDCEGAEWPALEGCTGLGGVDCVVGELHAAAAPADAAERLAERLGGRQPRYNFEVRLGEERGGVRLFRAFRPGKDVYAPPGGGVQ